MHPILANQERLSIYLLGWLILGGMVAAVLALSHDFSGTEALTLALPITIIYGIICLSSWYVCRVYPLEKTPFDPQVVVIVASPWAMLKLAQSTLFRVGGRIEAEFAGIQSVCADACAQTYLNGKVNFSLGCDGSRKFSGIEDGEMVMGIPAEILPELIEALNIVAAAPGSKPGGK